jgi:hypothetical protein
LKQVRETYKAYHYMEAAKGNLAMALETFYEDQLPKVKG